VTCSRSSPSLASSISLTEEETKSTFDKFINARNSEDIDQQIEYLSQDFQLTESGANGENQTLDYDGYLKKEKKQVNQYGSPTLEASNPQYLPNEDGFVVRYSQHYKLSGYAEVWGTVDLYLRKRDGKVEIYKQLFSQDSYRSLLPEPTPSPMPTTSSAPSPSPSPSVVSPDSSPNPSPPVVDNLDSSPSPSPFGVSPDSSPILPTPNIPQTSLPEQDSTL
jgi:hypothetical protein